MKRQQLLIISILVGIFGLYQNFSLIRFGLTPVDKENRKNHAKELLGKHYSGSSAQLASQVDDVHISIYSKVKEGLPKKFKSDAMFITQAIIEHSEFYDLDPVFTLAVIETESSFNPLAKGSFGEIGLMQIKPDTAEWIAKREGLWWTGTHSLENPITNIAIGTAYLNYLRNNFQGHANKYLAAYNMGPKNVRRIYASERKPREYPMRVMKNYNEFYLDLISQKSTSRLADNKQ
jgi:soluble lytic murein transglycosylase